MKKLLLLTSTLLSTAIIHCEPGKAKEQEDPYSKYFFRASKQDETIDDFKQIYTAVKDRINNSIVKIKNTIQKTNNYKFLTKKVTA